MLTPDLLRRVDSLCELDDEALLEFAAEATGTQRSKEKEPEIVSHMDNSRDVYFIIEGMARVDMFHTNGMRITFQILTEGQMFGELAAIDGLERSARVIVEE